VGRSTITGDPFTALGGGPQHSQ